jgi:hypothetical protein
MLTNGVRDVSPSDRAPLNLGKHGTVASGFNRLWLESGTEQYAGYCVRSCEGCPAYSASGIFLHDKDKTL